MRKLMILVMVTLLFGGASVYAQDASTCTIDLGDAFASMAQAQAEVSRENFAEALERVTEAREALAAIEAQCSGAAIPTRTYQAPNDTFTLNYPGDWRVADFTANPNGGLLLLGNSIAAAQALRQQQPVFQSGQQAMQVTIAVPATTGVDRGPIGVAEEFREIINQRYSASGEIESVTVGGREAARIDFSGSGFDATLLAIGLDTEGLRYAVVIGVTAPGERESLRAPVEQVITSIR